MKGTLILFEPLRQLGEALKKDCPEDDCTLFREMYLSYCEELADYERMEEDKVLFSVYTREAIERDLRRRMADMVDFWLTNYAITKYLQENAKKEVVEKIDPILPKCKNCGAFVDNATPPKKELKEKKENGEQ